MGEQCQFLYKSNLYSSNSVAVPIPFQEIHPFILLRRGPSLLHLATVHCTLYTFTGSELPETIYADQVSLSQKRRRAIKAFYVLPMKYDKKRK